MKSSKKVNQKAIGGFKKVFYRHRISGFKRILALMILGGLVFSLIYAVSSIYTDYAISTSDVSLKYPEIASSAYPDDSRFSYYDLVSDEKIEKALKKMQADGKYEYYTVDDIKETLFVYNRLDNSAKEAVSNQRFEGNDYSYVANEYEIYYVQPHDTNNPNILDGIFTSDYSDEFLKALMEVNKEDIADTYSGYAGFEILSDVGDTSSYDYKELVRVYRTRINSVISFLNELERNNPGFVSSATGMGVKDVVGEYNILVSNRLDSIESFIDTSGISKDTEVAANKLQVNIEDSRLKFNKYSDIVTINKYAQGAYDHTFTENLIVVTIHETYGLYQARPKTAFDVVTNTKTEAMKDYENYETEIKVLEEERAIYVGAQKDTEEYARLCKKCDGLISQLALEYEEVTDIARAVVREYSDFVNKNYIEYEIKTTSAVSRSLVVDCGVWFLIGAAVTFVIFVAVDVISGRRKLIKRKKRLNKIKKQRATASYEKKTESKNTKSNRKNTKSRRIEEMEELEDDDF